MVNEKEEVVSKGFNLVVHHRNPKTGLVEKADPYILRVCDAGNGGRTRLWERPKGSGNLYEKSGKPCGRWIDGKHDSKAEHIAFVAPLTSDQKLAAESIENKVRIAELERELAAIKAEKTKNGKGA